MAADDEIEFWPLHLPADLDLVHGWMQQPHAVAWWDLAGPREVVRDYLYARVRLAHRDCWIVDERHRPVAYVETFVVPEDELAGCYDAQPGDRGFDLLIGPAELLGSGVAQRVVRRLVSVLLRQHAITRVVCACDVRNTRHVTFCRALGAEPIATPAPGKLLLGWTPTSAAATGAGP